MFEYILENIISSVCNLNRYYQKYLKDEVLIMKSILSDIANNPPQYQINI